jgi:hypothetical protein
VRPALRIEPLDAEHDRSRFDCADDAINGYLRAGLDRDVGRFGCVAYMATLGDRTVVGFYTLSNAVVEKHRLTRSTRDRVPGYMSVPATLLGRMGSTARSPAGDTVPTWSSTPHAVPSSRLDRPRDRACWWWTPRTMR